MKKREVTGRLLSYFLMMQLGFLSIGAFYGGILMMADPSGKLLEMTTASLERSPFQDYFWPGLILLIGMGLLPIFSLAGLIIGGFGRSQKCIPLYNNMHNGWTLSLASGIGLVLWMDIQIWLIGYEAVIQTIFSLYGVVIVITTLLPPVVNRYKLPAHQH